MNDRYEFFTSAADALRTGASVDHEQLAEILDEMARGERREMRSRITQILEHLIKLQNAQGVLLDHNRNGWEASILRQQGELDSLFENSHSLRQHLTSEVIAKCYAHACRTVLKEYEGVILSVLEECPFTVTEILGD